MKQLLLVRVLGTGINDSFNALSHEIVGLPAGTYHKFILPNGIEYYLNDFGIRSVAIEHVQETPPAKKG